MHSSKVPSWIKYGEGTSDRRSLLIEAHFLKDAGALKLIWISEAVIV